MTRSQLIVVGAGSAGCVLASRLAREFGIRVTLLEPPVNEAPAINRLRPSRWLKQLGSTEDWGFRTQPDANLAARSIAWPRGRGLGGSSRINAMIWFPPTANDLQMLCEAAGSKWNRGDLEAAYRSLESIVQPESPRWLSEPSHRFLAAAAELSQATPMTYRRLCHRGRRWLPSEWLPSGEPPFTIVRGIADRLIWDKETAVGVRVLGEQSNFDLHASQGVVLTAGAIGTPTILMRSGVGTDEELVRHGIEHRLDCPSMGKHLRDHLIMPIIFELNESSQGLRAIPTMQDLARWQVMGTGPIASNLAECGGLFQNQSIQIHVTPTHYLTYPRQEAVASMTIGVNVTQPESMGEIRLASKHPEEAPEIAARYLDCQADLAGTILGIRLARQIAERTPLAEMIRRESIPGSRRLGDDELARAIHRYSQTLYHPVGTCRMGDSTHAAIDHQFALYGAQGVWVVDASVLPQQTIGNPNATVMTLAWWAAERIAGRVQTAG